MTVICFGVLRDFLPPGSHSNELELEIEGGATVGDLAAHLGAPRRLIFSALVGEARAHLAEPLQDGARVTLMPPFTGG